MKTNSYKIIGKDAIRLKTRFGISEYTQVNLQKIDLDKSIPEIIEQLENF